MLGLGISRGFSTIGGVYLDKDQYLESLKKSQKVNHILNIKNQVNKQG